MDVINFNFTGIKLALLVSEIKAISVQNKQIKIWTKGISCDVDDLVITEVTAHEAQRVYNETHAAWIECLEKNTHAD
jgi:hypothetical protein